MIEILTPECHESRQISDKICAYSSFESDLLNSQTVLRFDSKNKRVKKLNKTLCLDTKQSVNSVMISF